MALFSSFMDVRVTHKNCIYLRCTTEKAMAPHSSTLAWKIPRTEQPGRLLSMGSLRVRHDWATSLLWATPLSFFTFLHWRRKWQPTPVFLPGESQGQGSLEGYSQWGHKELDTTEWLILSFHMIYLYILLLPFKEDMWLLLYKILCQVINSDFLWTGILVSDFNVHFIGSDTQFSTMSMH